MNSVHDLFALDRPQTESKTSETAMPVVFTKATPEAEKDRSRSPKHKALRLGCGKAWLQARCHSVRQAAATFMLDFLDSFVLTEFVRA